jgi:hypothetical protein
LEVAERQPVQIQRRWKQWISTKPYIAKI